VAMSTTGKLVGKCIGTGHYQNRLRCNQQNPCQLGIYGNGSGRCWMAVVRRDRHEFDPEQILETWDSNHPTRQQFKDQLIA
jgi:hypothetical protein